MNELSGDSGKRRANNIYKKNRNTTTTNFGAGGDQNQDMEEDVDEQDRF